MTTFVQIYAFCLLRLIGMGMMMEGDVENYFIILFVILMNFKLH